VTPLTGALNAGAWDRQKSRFPTSIWLHRLLSTLRPTRCYQHGAAGSWQVVKLTAGKRCSFLMAGDDDEMFMARSLNVTPKTTEQHLIVRNDKSVAYVTNDEDCDRRFVLTDMKHCAASLRQQYLFCTYAAEDV